MSVIRPERGGIYHRQGLDTLDRRCDFLQQMSARVNAFTPQSVIIRFAADVSPVNNIARRVNTHPLKRVVVCGDVYKYSLNYSAAVVGWIQSGVRRCCCRGRKCKNKSRFNGDVTAGGEAHSDPTLHLSSRSVQLSHNYMFYYFKKLNHPNSPVGIY